MDQAANRSTEGESAQAGASSLCACGEDEFGHMPHCPVPAQDREDKLRAIIDGWAQHDSWRCAHPPHYYFAGDPPDDGDCACGLLSMLKEAGIDPAPWQPEPKDESAA